MDWLIIALGVAWLAAAIAAIVVGVRMTRRRRSAWPLLLGSIPAAGILGGLSLMYSLNPIPALALTLAAAALTGFWLTRSAPADK